MQQTPSSPNDKLDGSGRMFDKVAPKYDFMNRLISLGLDKWWRRILVRHLDVQSNENVLDVATGTADVAIEICRQYEGVRVVGLDPSTQMLAIGQRKVINAALADRISLLSGVAEQLQFRQGTFGASCIAFGIRNVRDRHAALIEMVRVTRKNGRVAILEVGQVKDSFFAPIVRWFFRRIVPLLGHTFAKNYHEYHYLVDSAERFPEPSAFAKQMERAGLRNVYVEYLLFGAVCLYVGEV